MRRSETLPLDDVVRDVIERHKVKTQHDIVQILEKQGQHVQQSSVSRVLHRLNATKRSNEKGEVYYHIPQHMVTLETALVKSVIATDTMVIVHTRTGAAGHVCQLIDEAGVEDIAGTIAGENTIFISPTSSKKIDAMHTHLLSIFNLNTLA